MSIITNQECIIWHPNKKADRYGDEAWDWTTATQTTQSEVSVQPSASSEDTLDRQTTVSGWRFYGPPETVLHSIDRVQVGGSVYDVVDEPQAWPDPINPGMVDHWEASLQIIVPSPLPMGV